MSEPPLYAMHKIDTAKSAQMNASATMVNANQTRMRSPNLLRDIAGAAVSVESALFIYSPSSRVENGRIRILSHFSAKVNVNISDKLSKVGLIGVQFGNKMLYT